MFFSEICKSLPSIGILHSFPTFFSFLEQDLYLRTCITKFDHQIHKKIYACVFMLQHV